VGIMANRREQEASDRLVNGELIGRSIVDHKWLGIILINSSKHAT
jgi:hypothetical protein